MKPEKRIEVLFSEAEQGERCVVKIASKCNHEAIRRRLGTLAVSPLPGLYARKDYWERLTTTQQSLHIARSLAIKHPDWVFCGPTAAAAWGLETPRTLLKTTYIVSNGHAVSRPSVRRIIAKPENTCFVQGIPVVDALTATLDCLRIGTFPEALAVADSALRKLGLQHAELESAVRNRLRGKRGAMHRRRQASSGPYEWLLRG